MANRQESDKVLVRQMQSGDAQMRRAALAAWWEQDSNRLLRFVVERGCRYGFTPDICEDIAWESFTRAIKQISLARYEDRDKPLIVFLYGIAKKVISSEWRIRKRLVSLEGETVDGETYERQFQSEDDELTAVEERIDQEVHLAQLRQGISSLSEKQRILLELDYGQGWKAKEIGQEMGMTDGYVRRELFRVREKLKRFLRP